MRAYNYGEKLRNTRKLRSKNGNINFGEDPGPGNRGPKFRGHWFRIGVIYSIYWKFKPYRLCTINDNELIARINALEYSILCCLEYKTNIETPKWKIWRQKQWNKMRNPR